MSDPLTTLASRLGDAVRLREPLAKYTTYRIGGPAAALVQPGTVEDVAFVLDYAMTRGIPWVVLGLGSNVLIADSGFAGVVLRIGKGLDGVSDDGDGRWRVGAGTPTPLLARKTAAAGLAGVHRLIGVPGTVGGGIAMNAGAHGQEFAGVVRSVELVEPTGVVKTIGGEAIPWRYRSSGLSEVVVVGAELQFSEGDPPELERDVRRHLAWRKAGTPFNEACCGSVFRNPEPAVSGGRSAGQLIDGAGLKGHTIGQAQVSPLHANYIVNLGGATAEDVRAVIGTVRDRVAKVFGVELQLEVRLIGWDG